MIPQLISSLLPASLTEIAASTSLANVLRESLGEAVRRAGANKPGTFFQFVNYMRSQGQGGLNMGQAYREAKFWSQQGEILGQYPSGTPLDPRLARDIKGTGPHAGEFGGYRIGVTVHYTNPKTGESFDSHVWVTSATPPTLDRIWAKAEQASGDKLRDSPQAGDPDDIEGYVPSFQIFDFGRFI